MKETEYSNVYVCECGAQKKERVYPLDFLNLPEMRILLLKDAYCIDERKLRRRIKKGQESGHRIEAQVTMIQKKEGKGLEKEKDYKGVKRVSQNGGRHTNSNILLENLT